jgi:hypothetical protein
MSFGEGIILTLRSLSRKIDSTTRRLNLYSLQLSIVPVLMPVMPEIEIKSSMRGKIKKIPKN